MAIPFYLIVNQGMLATSDYVRAYPRHLVLAQLYLESADYRLACKDLRKRNGLRIILDNGAHEDVVIELEDYMKVIDELRPDVFVLPDIVGEANWKSRKRSMDFAVDFKKYSKDPSYRPVMMYCPQGQNRDQIRNEFDWAQTSLKPPGYIIGFGQSYLAWERGTVRHEHARMELMSEVLSEKSNSLYHILGGRWQPLSFQEVTDGYRFIGLDSIKPCTAALQGHIYPNHDQHRCERLGLALCSDEMLEASVKAFCKRYSLEA